MADISAAAVKELRERTGAGFMDCKRALEETGGDIDAAAQLLRDRSTSMAAKKGHERGTAHEFTPEEARVAGRKGGLARAMNRGTGHPGDAESESGGSMS